MYISELKDAICTNAPINEIKTLLINGASPNDIDEEGWASIHFAVENGDVELCRLLIEYGVDVNIRTLSGYTPFHIMIETGTYSLELATLLINSGAHVGHDIHKALYLQDIKLVEQIISSGVSIDTPDDFGNRILHNSIAIRCDEFIQKIIDLGASLEVADHYDTRPIHAAAADAHLFSLKLLIEKGADLESRDYNGRTALIFAAGNAFIQGVQLLISSGAFIDIQDNFGNTPLHYAFENGEDEIARLLISNGANTNLRNQDGQLPIDLYIVG